MQFDFLQNQYWQKNHPPYQNPTTPEKKSCFFVGVFCWSRLKKPNKTTPTAASVSKPPTTQTEPWWLSQYHRTWQASTNGRSSPPRRRPAWGRGRPYWRDNRKGHDGWEDSWDLPGEINKWWFKMVQFETQAGKLYNSAWFFLVRFLEVNFMLNSRHFVNGSMPCLTEGQLGFCGRGITETLIPVKVDLFHGIPCWTSENSVSWWFEMMIKPQFL